MSVELDLISLKVSNKRIAIIGGGAAGFFAAISAKQHEPEASVTIYEKSNKLLAKVKVSGGGRCNVTHACFEKSALSKFYPRGGKQLRKAFDQFYTQDTVDWFTNRGVELKVESDNRMFPTTDNSQTIIDTLMEECKRLGIRIALGSGVSQILRQPNLLSLTINNQELLFDKVIVATGGSPKTQGFDWIKALGHTIQDPVPSLFTFNMPKEKIKALMGLSVPNATVRVQKTKLMQSGPLLITHWGMSGPAILKTSAWGARLLSDLGYQFAIHVNWLGNLTEADFRAKIDDHMQQYGKRLIRNKNPFLLPQRLWDYLIEKVAIDSDKPWLEIGKKGVNKLLNVLLNDQYEVSGKTTFKEEFVTCGGISLAEVDFKTMESRVCSGLYFAGEVLDIDGITGGFNFQAAWTTGFIAGKHSE
ncbi:BaiN/RdsA family NAD(P)/FAD-dependent oxidoreductase [Roseivirga misakiensis]|uniref:Flavoprotein n=1 Tax=Roseivirga misakiensis TaxID=1563681 RepID=A0A1E5T022_9BACT|nr:NAD(P)/FAD-dependent oxidoreductase [Roseivirga misakiensis]OEK04705.1 flavoprotein [Roseivirga misakiensis]